MYRIFIEEPSETSSRYAVQEGIDAIPVLSHIRTAVISKITHNLPHAHAQLLGGILIGARQSLPKELSDSFKRVGLTHIIAVSGYNITILLAVLYAIVAKICLRRIHALGIVLACIAGFTILTGGSASAVRAAIMGGLVVVAQALGRGTRIHTAIVLTAAIMMLLSPRIFVDIGFQLSFLAMIGLVYLSPVFERLAESLRDFFGCKDILIQTFSAICVTSPLILWYFGTVSIIAPLANLLVVPVVPLAMAFGGISTALSFFGTIPLMWIFAWAPLEYIIRVSVLLSHTPFASVIIHQPLVIYTLVVCSYAVLAVVLQREASRRKRTCALS